MWMFWKRLKMIHMQNWPGQWKHAYSSISKILQPEKENFQIQNSDIFFFQISAQNIDCGYSLEPPHTHNLCF